MVRGRRGTDDDVNVGSADAGIFHGAKRRLERKIGSGLLRCSAATLADPRARDNPLVIRIEVICEMLVG